MSIEAAGKDAAQNADVLKQLAESAERSHSNKRTDGSDGQAVSPVIPPPATRPVNVPATPGAQNAAMKEAAKPGEGVDPLHEHAARLEVLDAAKGLIGYRDGRPRRKKRAICGFASATRGYILNACASPDWEIYGLNQLYRHIPRADVWADIHYNWNEEVVPGTDYVGWVRGCGIPMLMHTVQPDLPTSVRFPLTEILDSLQADYFTSTIAYLVAFTLWEIDREVGAAFQQFVMDTPKEALAAVDLQAELRSLYGEYTIGVFGVDLTVGTEYFHEKACAEFWIGRAVDRGIEVAIPKESALCKQQYRYGYERAPQSLVKTQELIDHRAGVTAELDEVRKRMCMLEGMVAADEYWQQVAELRERGTQVILQKR